MDTQPSQSKKMDDNAQMPLTEKQNENQQSSRFSRRRFIQSGIAASPLLLSVKSPVAWGCTNTNNSSVTGRISGNASTSASSGCTPKNPSDWCQVFKGGDKQYSGIFDKWQNRDVADSSSFKDALSICGIHSSTSFLDLFCNELSNWASCNTNSGWQYKILTSRSDDPSVGDALQSSNCNLVLRVQQVNTGKNSEPNYSNQNNSTMGLMGYSITSSNNNKCFDINISDLNLHKNLTCGYLNGVLAPNVIAYEYTQTDILNGFKTAISRLADDIAQYGKNYQTLINSPCSSLRDNLGNTWPEDSCYS